MLKQLSDSQNESIKSCSFCNDICVFACPVFEAERKTITYPSRKALIGYNICNDWIEFDEEAAEVFYLCSSCRLCYAECVWQCKDKRRDPVDAFKHFRAEAYTKGVAPPTIEQLEEKLSQGSLYGRLDDKLEALKKECAGSADTKSVVVADADNLALAFESATASVRLLNKIGALPLISDVYETGYDVVGVGLEARGIALAKKMADYLNGLDVEKIVVLSPKTYWAFTTKYPEWGAEIKKELLFESAYLLEITYMEPTIKAAIESLYKVQNFGMLEGYATYHDGSYFARYIKEYDSCRLLLKPRFDKLIEMRNNRFKAVPVAPEDFPATLKESTLECMARERLKDIDELGVDYVVVSDPSSYAALKKYCCKKKVRSVSEVMLETFMEMDLRV